MYTGQRGLAVRQPTHPVCGLGTVAAPVPFLDARRPVDLHQTVIYRPVKVQAPGAPFEARLRHPVHDNAPRLDGSEPHPVALAREDLSDRVFELLV